LIAAEDGALAAAKTPVLLPAARRTPIASWRSASSAWTCARTRVSVVGETVGTVEVVVAWRWSFSDAARAPTVDARTEARSDWT